MKKSLEKSYMPTEAELTCLKSNLNRLDQKAPAPRLKLKDSGHGIAPDHTEQDIGHLLLMESLGASDYDFLEHAIGHLSDLSTYAGEVSECRINELLAVVKGIAPRDEVECLLACQMAAIHDATMATAKQLRNAEHQQTLEYAGKMLPKLAKTYTTQMGTLKKYRDGGQQKITVQHVDVNEGGQAIIGNINREAPGGSEKNEA